VKNVKVMSIFGTRPEVIKLAPVFLEMDRSPFFDSVLVTTGQHREMLGQALKQFGIDPHYNLDIMVPGQTLTDVTINSLRGMEELIATEKPDLVLVQGDTTSAFAGCLAAFYQKTEIGHVEAGLRTYEKYRPFPEEINRSLITQLADVHFVPTPTAWESLRREGVTGEKVFITGNTVIDSLYEVVEPDYEFSNSELSLLDGNSHRLIVVTAHRRESFGQPLRDICQGIATIVDRFADVEVVFSVHRNPKVKIPVQTFLGGHERIHLVPPLEYIDMANLLSRSYMVMTDSGGLQEEAPALAKPVLVLRDVTERPEAAQIGLSRVIGTSTHSIVSAATELLTDEDMYAEMARGISPYGDGEAAGRIVSAIEYLNGLREQPPEAFESLPSMAITGDQTIPSPVSDELFYQQLDERIERARQERRKVSVATFNLENINSEQFANAFRVITRGLRETDTATALDGRRLVLVLPGASEVQARKATDRLMDRLSNPLNGFNKALDVEIKTYTDDDDNNDGGDTHRDVEADIINN
jgi:UDP-N-acetylglucosamine 2-epimerase